MEFWKLELTVRGDSYEEVMKMLEKAKGGLEDGHLYGSKATDKSNYSYFMKETSQKTT